MGLPFPALSLREKSGQDASEPRALNCAFLSPVFIPRQVLTSVCMFTLTSSAFRRVSTW